MLKGTPQLRKHPACIVQLTKQRFYFLPNCLIVGILLNIEYNFFTILLAAQEHSDNRSKI
jgi:hypothetical protein